MDINNLSKRAQELWNEWEIRSLILSSLFLQSLLIVTRNRRKYHTGIVLGGLVWIAYMSADWEVGKQIATIKLQTIFQHWHLLVHLGGPDTITAYALEDNELWLRRLLQLQIQTATAAYSLFKSWGKDPLIYIAIPIFVAGLAKYGERILVLWLASSNKFRDIENEEVDTFQSEFSKLPSTVFFGMSKEDLSKVLKFDIIADEALYLHEAHFLFQMFKIFYADLALSHSSHMASYRILTLQKYGYEEEQECRHAHMPSNFLSSASALVAFSLMIMNKSSYTETEVIISYILLGGGVVLEIYGVIMLLLSDWAMLRLSLVNKPWANAVFRAIYSDNNKRWERYMAQHDLADAQITNEGFWTMVKKSLVCKSSAKVCFLKLIGRIDIQRWEEILAERGDQVLKSMGYLEISRTAVVGLDFHGSLLLWHIATDICHHDDILQNKGDANKPPPSSKMSRSLSNYMLYLLSERPNMLPKGIGEARYKQTGIQLAEFSWCWRSIPQPQTHWGSDGFLKEIQKHDQSNVSMLHDACKLANELQHLETGEFTKEDKWRMISKIWVEMLTYAASNCGWKEHGQALTNGGELLTRVCLLMAHLGLSEQCLTSAKPSSGNADNP
uniref:DUF4220 domain-containing protein n=1 Tax=Salix viminalis TaxID=40686 RepID=A0A6N2K1S8_SALVM